MKKIYLTKSKYALVDDDDFEFLNKWNWSAVKGRHTFYAHRNSKLADNIGSKRRSVLMHRVIMRIDGTELQIDHKNGDGLNNQKNNLRVCNNSQNQKNRRSKGASKYLGVSASSSGSKKIAGKIIYKKWKANILANNKEIYLGHFDNEIDAAIAYNKAATKHHGEFANLNTV